MGISVKEYWPHHIKGSVKRKDKSYIYLYKTLNTSFIHMLIDQFNVFLLLVRRCRHLGSTRVVA
jgi:hypothetical protein